MRTRRRVVAAVGVAATAVVLFVQAAQGGDRQRDALRALSRGIARVAAQVRPAVVSVYTTKTVRMWAPGAVDPFEDFFRPFGPFRRREPLRPRRFRQRGLGSGFIIDAEKGYIVTNYHVVDKADGIKVRLSDRREVDAKLVGGDKKTDLAVIRIKAAGLKAVTLGDSEKLQVGEIVLAIGSPFGLRETVSLGIVSAKGRSNLGIEDYEDFIQTDAAINQGNSGGPLVNVDGEVIGVNTAIISGGGGSVGVGFAIPINMAKSIIDQLVKTGKVVRGWLGVMIQDVSADIAEKFGLDKAEGALVSQVLDGTPAAKAKLKPGDIIVRYGRRRVPNVTKLRRYVAATRPGTRVKIVVVRDGQRVTLTARIGKLTDAVVASAHGGATTRALGLSVQDLTPELAKQLGIRTKEGVVVTAVREDSPAAEKGLKRGSVITQVDRRPVKNVAEFTAALKRADLKKGVLLLVVDREGSRFVVLKAGED